MKKKFLKLLACFAVVVTNFFAMNLLYAHEEVVDYMDSETKKETKVIRVYETWHRCSEVPRIKHRVCTIKQKEAFCTYNYCGYLVND